MKQIFFLLLFPCLALAQYQGNANQKITLGEQTTADGLVWRGRLADTANLLTNKLDTSVYIVLDTGTRAMWYYRASTTPKWTRLVDSLNNLQGQLSLTSKVTGTLPVANGGTNTSTAFTAGSVVFAGASGTYSQDNSNLFWDNTNKRLGIGTTSPGYILQVKNSDASVTVSSSDNTAEMRINAQSGLAILETITNTDLRIRTYSTERMRITSGGNVGIGTNNPQAQLHTTGGVRFATFAGGGTTTLSVDNAGDLLRTSTVEYKKDIEPIRYGLKEVLALQPVNFNWIDEDRFGSVNENGFVAEDVMNVLPNVANADGNGVFMDYTKLIAVLTKAIQEQQALIKALEQRIINLENK